MTKKNYIVPEQIVVDLDNDMDVLQSISNVSSGNGEGWGTDIPIIGGDPKDDHWIRKLAHFSLYFINNV